MLHVTQVNKLKTAQNPTNFTCDDFRCYFFGWTFSQQNRKQRKFPVIRWRIIKIGMCAKPERADSM